MHQTMMSFRHDPDAVRGKQVERDLIRRVLRMARPYRASLWGFIIAVFAGAIVGVIPPLLFRSLLDTAVPQKDERLVIILAIAVPKYNNARMQANELSAIRMVGTIHTTQAQYQSQFGKYAVTLQELGPPPSGQPGPAAADLIPGDLAKGKKSGFVFQMQGTPGGYTLTVVPETYNSSGRRSFYSDQSMVIRENWGPEPATVSSKEVGN